MRAILQQYAPKAKTVLDPFGGTATTAFTASEMGLGAFVCEVNPVMQFIFEAKSSIRTMPAEARVKVSDLIRALANNFSATVSSCSPDRSLSESYVAAFGSSEFLPSAALARVLQCRALVDELTESDAIVGNLLCVAIVAALVPASFLKRAGDLRFMNERELKKGIPRIDDVIRGNLRRIAEDVGACQKPLAIRPVLLCGDARDLSALPSINASAVVTSPPYINGTNYFRNTRLELWFLRCLRHAGDLRYFREKAITGGINDVTNSKSSAPHTSAVSRVTDALAANAYDQRIPMMVASYFAEMTQTFKNLSTHLAPKAVVAIDIGDSNYNGVHVPADSLLVHCLQEVGYVFKRDIELRKRRSKNGAPLRQALLILEWPRRARATSQPKKTEWQPRWSRFARDLPHQQQPFSARNWGSGLHSLCSYPGKLKPAIAHHLVEAFVPESGMLLDPFAGVGTIPLEAALTGRRAFGMDLSPAAYAVAAAKATINKASGTASVLRALDEYVNAYIPPVGELNEVRSFGMNGKISRVLQLRILCAKSWR